MTKRWPAEAVEMRDASSLIPYARNARVHSAQQIAKVAASIAEFGWTVPILVDDDGVVIAGHCRLLAAEKMGIDEVPVMVARGWSEAQRRAYVIADNKLTLDSEWDPELLQIEFDELEDLGFDLSLTGFDTAGVADVREASVPDFSPAAPETSSDLDKREPKTCPHCGEPL